MFNLLKIWKCQSKWNSLFFIRICKHNLQYNAIVSVVKLVVDMEDINQDLFLFYQTHCNPVLYLAAVVLPPRERRRPSWPACSGHWLPYSGRGDGTKAAPPSHPHIPHLHIHIEFIVEIGLSVHLHIYPAT